MEMPAASNQAGRLYLVGLGPGAPEHMTAAARHALQQSDVVIGYRTYVDLVRDVVAGKRVIESGMRQEVSRVRAAIRLAEEGHTVAVVCSGDAGVYGMAGLAYEVLRGMQHPPEALSIEVVPGISALSAAASLLGAPLMHDFAVISLSDLLTPLEDILHRVEAAAVAGFVLVFYNPSSARRQEPLQKVHHLLLQHRDPATPAGVVTSAYRPGQTVIVTDLGHLLEQDIGMLSTVVVGNSSTFRFGDAVITPRGYGRKYRLAE